MADPGSFRKTVPARIPSGFGVRFVLSLVGELLETDVHSLGKRFSGDERLALLGDVFRLRLTGESLGKSAPETLVQIIRRSANILGIGGDYEGFAEIARRSRGTPRIANRLLRRVRDYAQVRGGGTITKEDTVKALEMLEVDRVGLDKMDTLILSTLIDKFGGGPVGLETLSAAIGEEKDTIEDAYEPYLIQIGFLSRTPRGRVATPLAYDHFGRRKPASKGIDSGKQPDLL